ncbi:MAG: type VI secretion system tip protein TssI/VgrG [Sphingomonadales bacterium]
MPSSSDRIGKITTSPDRQLLLTAMTAIERLSELFVIEAQVVAEGGPVDLHQCLSKPVSFSFAGKPHVSRHFSGILCEYAEIGRENDGKDFVYRLVVRPQQYLKTLNRKSIIHHKRSIADLVQMLAPQEQKFQSSYSQIEYRVQYDESDFNFVSRHLEREGIYYYFEHSAGSHTLVAVDNPQAHTANSPATVRLATGTPDGKEGLLWAMREHRRFAATGYTVDDYDYTAPTVSLKRNKAKANVGKGAARWRAAPGAEVSGSIAERYEYPGNYAQTNVADGERYAGVRLEADRAEMARSQAEGDVFAAAVGRKLKVAFDESGHGNSFVANSEYLIVGTRHHYHASGYRSGGGGEEDMRVELELMPADHPFRPAQKTPLPRIYGPQTAVVVGPSGEEIYTDKYGRIKVKFFWDVQAYQGGGEVHARSLWVRVAQMSAGKGFGAFMIPRIGHEVVVEFLNGDPDRPLVTGSVYNEDNLPAFGTAPANPLQGLRTNSTKGGGGFNEIRFDDSKDKEMFHVQAEKDLDTLVLKGNETRTVRAGSRTTTIKKDDTLTVEDGNVVTTVKKGDETRKVEMGKRTTEINGDETLTVKTGNRKAEIQMGDDTLKISMGNRTTTITMGNDTTTLNLGASSTEALQSIELKCGGSTIKIDPMSITIKAMMVKIEGEIMLQTKGLMVQQEASALHIIKGGLVMIN